MEKSKVGGDTERKLGAPNQLTMQSHAIFANASCVLGQSCQSR